MDSKLQLPAQMNILDHTGQTDWDDILVPFALEELLCRRVGQGETPMVHMWRHPRALVMGLRDSRLPGAGEAKQWLENLGYSVAVRHSGGAAVPLDLGVVNVSIILPKSAGSIDFRNEFELMYSFIGQALQKLTPKVEKGEVEGSYCPGDFDLSIDGKKFCGIAQRRQAHALVVQAFVVVEGSGQEKAALVRKFYDIAAAGACNRDYPLVIPDRMASLSECISPLAAEEFIRCVHELLQGYSAVSFMPQTNLPQKEEIIDMVDTLRKRYRIDS